MQLRDELADLRRRQAPVPVDITRDRLAPFLAGFASAEAHFGASSAGSPIFVVNVRSDDGPLLRCFRDAVHAGYLRDVAPAGRSQAATSWRVGRLSELRRLVGVLDECPPRGRVAGVYAAWRELVLLDPRPGDARRRLAAEVRRRRAYRPGLELSAPEDAGERARRRCLEALDSWSEAAPGGASSGAYEAWRRSCAPDAPTRNTVAAAFGSWREALTAAGIGSSTAMPATRVAAIQAGSAASRARRRRSQRRRVLATVQECIAALGREPRASEFLRWRTFNAPESPCQMTIYRVFPGGWMEVLACARAARAPNAAA
jgi:hypothetical protein